MAATAENNNDNEWVKFIIGTVGVLLTVGYIIMKFKTGN